MFDNDPEIGELLDIYRKNERKALQQSICELLISE